MSSLLDLRIVSEMRDSREYNHKRKRMLCTSKDYVRFSNTHQSPSHNNCGGRLCFHVTCSRTNFATKKWVIFPQLFCGMKEFYIKISFSLFWNTTRIQIGWTSLADMNGTSPSNYIASTSQSAFMIITPCPCHEILNLRLTRIFQRTNDHLQKHSGIVSRSPIISPVAIPNTHPMSWSRAMSLVNQLSCLCHLDLAVHLDDHLPVQKHLAPRRMGAKKLSKLLAARPLEKETGTYLAFQVVSPLLPKRPLLLSECDAICFFDLLRSERTKTVCFGCFSRRRRPAQEERCGPTGRP